MAISKISEVARPDTYQTLEQLQHLGLIEKMVAYPSSYGALPLKKGLSLLLETKTEQYEKLKADTESLCYSLNMKKKIGEIEEKSSQFILVPEGKSIIKKIRNAIEKTQVSIDLVLSWKRFAEAVASAFVESIETAWAKNVKIRFIVEAPLESKTSKGLIQYCRGKPSCQIRFSPDQLKTFFGVFDKKEVFVMVIPGMNLQGSPALWSNNEALISLATDHFEGFWTRARKTYSGY